MDWSNFSNTCCEYTQWDGYGPQIVSKISPITIRFPIRDSTTPSAACLWTRLISENVCYIKHRQLPAETQTTGIVPFLPHLTSSVSVLPKTQKVHYDVMWSRATHEQSHVTMFWTRGCGNAIHLATLYGLIPFSLYFCKQANQSSTITLKPKSPHFVSEPTTRIEKGPEFPCF